MKRINGYTNKSYKDVYIIDNENDNEILIELSEKKEPCTVNGRIQKYLTKLVGE